MGARTWRRQHAGALLALFTVTCRVAAAQDGLPHAPDATVPSVRRSLHAFERVRSSGEPLTTVLREAARRSPTFRTIVDTIEQSDGIVYIEPGSCFTDARSCLIRLSEAGSRRFLRVHVAMERPEWDLMGAIAHELWHALEVLGQRGIRSTSAMHLFYERQGLRTSSGFETTEAVRAGNQVRREVRAQILAVEGQ